MLIAPSSNFGSAHCPSCPSAILSIAVLVSPSLRFVAIPDSRTGTVLRLGAAAGVILAGVFECLGNKCDLEGLGKIIKN